MVQGFVAVITVAVILFVLALVALRSWQLRRRRRLGYLVQNTWEFRLRNQIRRCFGEHTAAALASVVLQVFASAQAVAQVLVRISGQCHYVACTVCLLLRTGDCLLVSLPLASRVQGHFRVYEVSCTT